MTVVSKAFEGKSGMKRQRMVLQVPGVPVVVPAGFVHIGEICSLTLLH